MAVYEHELSDSIRGFTITVSPTMIAVGASVVSYLLVADDPGAFYRESQVVSSTLTVGDTLSEDGYLVFVRERMHLQSSTAGSNWTLGAVLANAIRLRDELLSVDSVLVSESITIEDVVAVIRALRVIEQLGIGDTLIGQATRHMSLTERVELLDTIRVWFGATITETPAVTDTLASLRRHNLALAGQVDVVDTSAATLVLRLDLSDEIEITAEQALRMIYAPVLGDVVRMSAAFVSPSAFTTWAINTRTGAATEYSSYTFNSIAPLGPGYAAAADTGLYQLAGDDDAGEDIIATLRSGLMQINQSRFSGLAAAYIGMRGGGVVLLRLIAGTGEEYLYRVTTRDMATTKVNVGKGIRHRFLAFELTTVGQDFDLESIEFVPMLAQRRV